MRNLIDIKDLTEKEIEELIKVAKDIMLNPEKLISLYNDSDYSILSQYTDDKNFDIKQWTDIFALIKLGHYDVTASQIAKAIEVFNNRFNEHKTSINDFVDIDSGQQYARLIERITFMKREAIDLCKERKV